MKTILMLDGMRRWAFVFAFLIAVVCAYAQANKPNIDSNADLDYDTNLSTPIVPSKQQGAICEHMGSIKDAIDRLGFDTELMRNGEVLSINIPCSDLFAPNDTVMKDGFKTQLSHLSNLLKYPTMYKIVVAVFSDDTGEPTYCDNLTAARANAIDEYLVQLAWSLNISLTNLIPYGMGQNNPRVENNSIANRALNRRAQIFIIPEWEMIETAKAGKLNR